MTKRGQERVSGLVGMVSGTLCAWTAGSLVRDLPTWRWVAAMLLFVLSRDVLRAAWTELRGGV